MERGIPWDIPWDTSGDILAQPLFFEISDFPEKHAFPFRCILSIFTPMFYYQTDNIGHGITA